MIVKDGKVLILNETIGLPAQATPEQVVARLKEIVAQAAETEKWQKRAEENRARLTMMEMYEDEAKELKAEIWASDLVTRFKIDSNEKPAYKELYLTDPDQAEKFASMRRENEYLKHEARLRGDFREPVNPLAEVEGRVAEMRAKDKSLSASKAQDLLFKEDPKLYERYLEYRRNGGKGGER